MSGDYDDLEEKMRKIKQCRDIDLALSHCAAGVLNEGIVYKIAAETDYGTQRGGAERSVNVEFTIAESARLFDLAKEMLTKRLAVLRSELGL